MCIIAIKPEGSTDLGLAEENETYSRSIPWLFQTSGLKRPLLMKSQIKIYEKFNRKAIFGAKSFTNNWHFEPKIRENNVTGHFVNDQKMSILD